MNMILAWHFADDFKLRDGQTLVVGNTYRHDGALEMCVHGLHASENVLDALSYAPGNTLSRVECSGEMICVTDKVCCRERRAIWALDAERVLWGFACECAERALERERAEGREPDPRSWEGVRVRREWLSGRATDDDLRAASKAAWAACEEAWEATGAASGASNAASEAVRATSAASWAASGASSAAREAMREPAHKAAHETSDEAAREAACKASDEAAWATSEAGWAAYVAERDWQRARLEELVEAERQARGIA